MAGEKYGDRAVAYLLDFIENNLATQLRAVETAQSLTSNSLTDPIDYKPAWTPLDAAGPIVQVFSSDGGPVDHRNAVYEYDCTVALVFASDADIEAAQLKARRYMTALIDVVASDRTLGGKVVEALDEDQSFFHDKPGNAQTLNAIALGVSVTVHEG